MKLLFEAFLSCAATQPSTLRRCDAENCFTALPGLVGTHLPVGILRNQRAPCCSAHPARSSSPKGSVLAAVPWFFWLQAPRPSPAEGSDDSPRNCNSPQQPLQSCSEAEFFLLCRFPSGFSLFPLPKQHLTHTTSRYNTQLAQTDVPTEEGKGSFSLQVSSTPAAREEQGLGWQGGGEHTHTSHTLQGRATDVFAARLERKVPSRRVTTQHLLCC